MATSRSLTPDATTAAARANQRNAVLAGFLGWTFDAFDFFVLTFVIDDVARSLGRRRPDIAFALTVALAMRPIGAIIFGLLADRYGRRIPLMINVIFYATVSILSGLAPNYTTFIILRMLFGIGMGGEWGVGASLALESASPRIRGVLSGLLQEGYATGNLIAALVFRTVYPYFEAHYPGYGWRVMFFVGGLPALLSLFIRSKVKESEAWEEHRTDWDTYRRSIFQHWKRFLYLVLLMAMMNFISHGTQDIYPTLLKNFGFAQKQVADVIALSMVGAILGGLVFGYFSDRIGRRWAIMIATVCALVMVPLWLSGQNTGMILVGVFLMQFFVQGAWGVIPAHINELSPGHLRGFFPGFAYQLGVLCASSIPFLETHLGEIFSYEMAMGGLVALVLTVGTIVVFFGPENTGVSFRKQA
jgi:SHS family lactate transporter-like MFS transporter